MTTLWVAPADIVILGNHARNHRCQHLAPSARTPQDRPTGRGGRAAGRVEDPYLEVDQAHVLEFGIDRQQRLSQRRIEGIHGAVALAHFHRPPPGDPAQVQALFAQLGQPATPEVLTLYTTLGGMAVFGINGFVMGPLIAAMFIAVWHIYMLVRPSAQPGFMPPDESAEAEE